MPLFNSKPQWIVYYEVLSADQDRAATFLTGVLQGDLTKEVLDAATTNAQKLFGRAYLVDLRTGMVRPLRMFDDAGAPTG
jgi:hypothetical protein